MTLKLIPADYGDCFLIRYCGSDSKPHNILIDGGLSRTYSKYLKQEIQTIEAKNEKIDLVVLTHIDQDHIEGILSFLKDTDIPKSIISQFWFNSKSVIDNHLKISTDLSLQVKQSFINTSSFKRKVSFEQGEALEYILNAFHGLNSKLVSFGQRYQFGGASIFVLSPNDDGIRKIHDKWLRASREKKKKVSSKLNDYSFSIEELSSRYFKADRSVANGSSIAFILEYNSKRILFSGDAHVNVIIESLKALGYNKKNKLKLEFLKLSHHGSKFNTNNELLDLVSCSKFIISTNGNYKNLPNKETLARVLVHPERSDRIQFIFNYNTPILRKIFTDFEKINYNFDCLMPVNEIDII